MKLVFETRFDNLEFAELSFGLWFTFIHNV